MNIVAATIGQRMRGQDDSVASNLVMDGPQTFDWQGGVSENDRAWLVDKPGRARALTSGGNNGGFRTEPGEHLVVGALQSHSKEHGHAMTTQQAVEAGHVIAYALNSHAGAADADVSNRSHTSGGPVGLGVSEELAHSLRAGRTQSTAGAYGVRRLTPRECERLQGFPDDWTAEGVNGPQSDSARYRQLGNAVAVPVAEWIGRRVVAVCSEAGG